MNINEAAPVIARGEIEIAASPGTIWDIMTAIGRWPEWSPDVRAAALDSELTPGATFRWKAGPGTIISTLREVEPPRKLAWTGTTMGISAVHVWEIAPEDGGATVKTAESWDGLLVRMFRRSMQRTLEHAIAGGLAALKTEAARREPRH